VELRIVILSSRTINRLKANDIAVFIYRFAAEFSLPHIPAAFIVTNNDTLGDDTLGNDTRDYNTPGEGNARITILLDAAVCDGIEFASILSFYSPTMLWLHAMLPNIQDYLVLE
jgi:hypothetical protein